MRTGNITIIIAAVMLLTILSACQSEREVVTAPIQDNIPTTESIEEAQPTDDATEELSGSEAPVLYYMGQASIRITTPESKVIYIDPYAGDDTDYESAADLILVTHSHFDHSATDKVKNRSEDCRIITQDEAIQDDEHITFDFGYVKVEPVEAGFNSLHDVQTA